MNSFKQFMELNSMAPNVRFNKSPIQQGGRQLHQGEPFVPTYAMGNRYDAMMSPGRRQMIDLDEPNQKYYYILIMMRKFIADIDTGVMVAGHRNDQYKIVYSTDTLGSAPYKINYEEQKMMEEYGILVWTKGYSHKEITDIIGKHNIENIRKFRHGQYINPEKHGISKTDGYFVDLDKIEKTIKKLEKWISIQDVLERGLQMSNLGLGSAIKQGAAMTKMPADDIIKGH